MIKGKKGQDDIGGPGVSVLQIIIFFFILFAIALIIIGLAGLLPQNIKAALSALNPLG